MGIGFKRCLKNVLNIDDFITAKSLLFDGSKWEVVFKSLQVNIKINFD